MANATVSYLGQINSSDPKDALFLKKFSGEVLTAFATKNVMEGRHMVRNITSGKSAQFPATWKAQASTHLPGEEILGGQIKHGEVVITIDDLLVAPVFISNIEEAKNHYDVRGTYSTEMGRALAKTYDQNVIQTGVLAARSSGESGISDAPGGSVLTNDSYATDGVALANGMFAARQALDEKDVPEEDTVALFRPAQFYLIVQNTDAINKDWGGQGSYADGNVVKIADIPVTKTNNLPKTNITSGNTKYQGDFSATAGLIMHKMAAGTVKLLDLAIESEYQVSRQGTLMVGKYAVGHGKLRPECAVEMALDTTTF